MADITGLIIDMDGVIWRSNKPIGDLMKIFNEIEQKQINYVFATNNSTLTYDSYIEKLNSFGLKINKNQLVTSSIATANYLEKIYPPKTHVYVIGENGLKRAIREKGFLITKNDPKAVIVGMDRSFSYEKLKNATLAIRKGSLFIGTNPDKTYPAEDGLHPGTGSILAAVEASTDISPYIIGKPYPTIYETAIQLLAINPENILVIGDRLETDIEGALKLGIKTALVLSGVTSSEMVDKNNKRIDIIANSLEEVISMLPKVQNE